MKITLSVIKILGAMDFELKKYQIIPIISGIVTVPEDKSKLPIRHVYLVK